MSDIVLPTHPRFINLTGRVFGRFTVVRFAGVENKITLWLCRCECGQERVIRGGNLSSGNSYSCGCWNLEVLVDRSTTHGESRVGKRTATYATWSNMMSRCYNPKVPTYPRWGGRGITVCATWHTYENFLADMGPKPTRHHSIDRIDNNGNYEPGNCRWATDKEQARNTRKTVTIAVDGERISAADCDERLGFKSGTIAQRLSRGWTVEQAITRKPTSKRNGSWSIVKPNKFYTPD